MNETIFAGMTALVTGGARGIGRTCCERLAQAGANVAINFRSSEQDAEETAKLVATAGGTAHLVRADVSSPEDVQAMVDEVEGTLGPVDLLVNNAGVFDLATHQETSFQIWQRTLDINLTGTYLVT